MDDHKDFEESSKQSSHGQGIEALQEVIRAQFAEQRRARRWRIFFRLALISLFIAVIAIGSFARPPGVPGMLERDKDHVAAISLEGVILDGSPAASDTINRLLSEAFENSYAKGVILRINSPGGSPVQSARINRKIQSLRTLYPDKPIYTVVDDICASGAYYIAVATDAIYVDASSLLGSIGVIYNGFGFIELMHNIGVERRVITAGKNKNIFDPFSTESKRDKQYIQSLLDNMHAHFIRAVKEGRGARLKKNKDIFSGLIWTGQKAVDLGLADGLQDMEYVAQNLIGVDDIVEYEPLLPFVQRVLNEVRVQMKQLLLEQALFAGITTQAAPR